MKMGEEKSFTIKIPAEVQDELAGKDIKFDVKVVIGSKITPAPLDDTLAKKLGLENIQLVMEGARSVASKKSAEAEELHYINQISSRLVAEYDFKIPSWLTAT